MARDTVTYVKAGIIGDMLGMHSDAVIRWAKSGDIPSIKLPNGRFLFDQEEVLSALKSKSAAGDRND